MPVQKFCLSFVYLHSAHSMCYFVCGRHPRCSNVQAAVVTGAARAARECVQEQSDKRWCVELRPLESESRVNIAVPGDRYFA